MEGNQAALRNARELWGKNTGQVFDYLKDYKAVLCIGIAGEKKIPLASIMPNRFYEKTGLENASMENIDRIHYDKALTEYYQHRGWTNEGIPGDHKLKKLGLWKS